MIGSADELCLLKDMGLEILEPEKGCCGLAGSFGFEAGHYEVSQAIGEQRLLPAVRAAGRDELVIANGFSCQTQIGQGTGREPKHLAEVLASALSGPHAPEPLNNGRHQRSGALTGALVAGGAVLAVGLLLRILNRSTTREPVPIPASGGRS